VRQRSENTVPSYGEDLKTLLAFCEQAELAKPDDVTFRHVEFYLPALRTFWRWMVREEITVKNPAADVFMMPTHKKLPDYLTIPEQDQLLAALARDPSLLGIRDYALVATALNT